MIPVRRRRCRTSLGRRGTGRRFPALLAVGVLLTGLAGCGGGKKAEPDIAWESVGAPAFEDGTGVLYPAVNPRGLPVDDIRRVSDVVAGPPGPGAGLALTRGTGDPFNDATVIVRRMPEGDEAAVATNADDDDQNLTLPDGREAVLLDAGDLEGTCARGLAVKAPSGGIVEVLTVTGGRQDLVDIAAEADLDGEGVPTVEQPPSGWRTIGTLAPGWTDREGASQLRYRLLGGSTVTAVPTTDAEQRILAAQLCRAPRSAFPPSGSLEETDDEWVGNLGSQVRRRWFVLGRVSYLGLLDGHTQVLLVPGSPGITLLAEFEGDPELSDSDLADYAENLELVDGDEFDRRAAEVTASQVRLAGEVARLALEERGHEVLPLHESGGLAYRFSRAPAADDGGERPLCLTVARRPDGWALQGHLRAPVPEPVCADPARPPAPGMLEVPEPEAQVASRVVWGLAGPGVVRVQSGGPSAGSIADVGTLPGAPDAGTVFVVRLVPQTSDGLVDGGSVDGGSVNGGGSEALVPLDAEGGELSRLVLPHP